ncbi:MAG: hypothetical protein JNM84_19295 [Planctomycetes bacterium]|nr:hypothetical protein [Planctomycetota bacterium]
MQPSDGPSFQVNLVADANGGTRFQLQTTTPGTRSFVACYEKGAISHTAPGFFTPLRRAR